MVNTKSSNIREILLNKVQSIPEDILHELYRYLLSLEKKPTQKEKIMAFSGAWADMDEEDFQEIITLNAERRKINRRDNRPLL